MGTPHALGAAGKQVLIIQDSWLYVGPQSFQALTYQAQQLQGVWQGCVTSPGGLGLLWAIL